MYNSKKVILIMSSIIIVIIILALQNRVNSVDKGAIAGQVTTVQGEPVVDASVMITGDSPVHEDIAALTNEQGEYGFDDLVPGDYAIMVNAENYAAQTRHAHVEAGHSTHLNFSLTILTSAARIVPSGNRLSGQVCMMATVCETPPKRYYH